MANRKSFVSSHLLGAQYSSLSQSKTIVLNQTNPWYQHHRLQIKTEKNIFSKISWFLSSKKIKRCMGSKNEQKTGLKSMKKNQNIKIFEVRTIPGTSNPKYNLICLQNHSIVSKEYKYKLKRISFFKKKMIFF